MVARKRVGLVDLSPIGLGDCVAGIAVISYLIEAFPHVFSPRVAVAVPGVLGKLAGRLLEPLGAHVITSPAIPRSRVDGQILLPGGPGNLRELASHLFGRSIYLNWSEGFGRAVTAEGEKERGGMLRKLRFAYLERRQFKVTDWRATPPYYVGLRLLFPVMLRTGRPLTYHVLAMKRSLQRIRAAVRSYGNELAEQSGLRDGVVVFPVAGSFNAMPAFVCAELEAHFRDRIHFAVTDSDPWIESYRNSIRNVTIVRTVEETLSILLRNFAICVDGFVSHLVQLVTDDALIIYAREPKERFTHPGAFPLVIEAHPHCAPCGYRMRVHHALCPQQRPYCVAYDSIKDPLIAAIDKALASAASRGALSRQ